MLKIFFTGGGGAGNEALYRLLSNTYDLYFGDVDCQNISPVIPREKVYEIPYPSSPDFIYRLSEVCKRLQIDLLVPTVDEELILISEALHVLAPTKILLPDISYIKKMLDKYVMIKELSNKNILVPRTIGFDEGIEDFIYPCIQKPKSGRGSRDVKILSSLNEAITIKKTLGLDASKILVQEEIKGVEYTVQMIANQNSCLHAVVPVRVDIKRGITIRCNTDNQHTVIATCKKIHEVFPVKGCYNIQLILTKQGQAIPFEINPRVSTTLCLVVAAGIDPFAIFFDDKEPSGLLNFNIGLGLQRHWHNFFID